MNDNLTAFKEFEDALRDGLVAGDFQVGDVVDGTIAAIHGDVALVEIGGKSEAVLPRDELDELGTGDPVEVVVVGVGSEIQVSRQLALERRLKEKLATAVASGDALDGKVVGRRKGGFDVTISGVRGFCPLSHIDDRRTDDLDQHLGQTYTFRVLEYDPEARKLVVSRAVFLREEKERQRAEAWQNLAEGAEVEGSVRSLTSFGAFVDLGGVDGLVHVTEISHRRIAHPKEVLGVGDQVRVKVLELDRDKDRISLSIKQLEPDPWHDVEARYQVRARFEGTVVRSADFGLFVELEPGLDGLLHVSQLPPGVERSAPELTTGATVHGWIRDVDVEAQRIGLTLRRPPDRDPWERVEMRYQEGQTVRGTVENCTDFGVFVELEAGLSALIPFSELGLGKGADPRESFAPGQEVEAKVLSVDARRQRISLSVKAQRRDRERQEYLQHMTSGDQSPAMTGFGARLAAALGDAPKPGKKGRKKA